MRWLLLKDLQIMRRSPLLTAILVVYPALIAVLIGFALSRGPSNPSVAFLSQVPADQSFAVGHKQFDVTGARSELYDRLDIVRVNSEAQARQKVSDGDVLAALIIPSDLVSKLRSGGLEQPTVKVIVNEEDPLKAQLVDDRIRALITEANLRLSRGYSDVTLDYLGLLLRGGTFHFLGQSIPVLGLRHSEQILARAQNQLPRNSADRAQIERVIRFSRQARQNLDLADNLLAGVSQPIAVDKEVVNGAAPSLDSFAISVAAAISLMFVTVLLVAGSLALEREENTFPRLVRGLVRPISLLGEKILLGTIASIAVTLLMLGGLTLFISIDWSRFGAILVAIAATGLAFAALGAAIGGLSRELRAASLLAFVISLPIVFVSLVPSGTVGAGLYDAIKVIRALFPFTPGQTAIESGLDAGGPGIAEALLHLLILALAYTAIARLALRRFAVP